MQRNYPLTSLKLLNILTIDTEQAKKLELLSQKIKNSLNLINTGLHDKLRSVNPVQISYPSIRWADNNTHVFIGIKYAPKFDSPGYININIKNEQINITENKVQLSAEIYEEAKTIKYVADIQLAYPIVKNNSSWMNEALGRVYIVLKKQSGGIWHKLSTEFVPNLVVWWDLKEKYANDTHYNDDNIKKMKDGIIVT